MSALPINSSPARVTAAGWCFRAAAALAVAVGAPWLGASVALAGEPPSPAGTVAPATVLLRFDVAGSAEVRTGIRGRVTIAGTFTGSLDPATGTFEGGFSLTPTRAHIVVLGLVPVVAETDWIFTEPVTGAWRDGVLQMRIAARIRHPHLYAYGSVLVAGGGRRATRRASVIELRSNPASPIADPSAGGTLATSGRGFTISPLAGCGVLDGLLSAVAAGDGNHSTITLTPRAD